MGILRAACQREKKSERELEEDENLPQLHEGELHGNVRVNEEKRCFKIIFSESLSLITSRAAHAPQNWGQ